MAAAAYLHLLGFWYICIVKAVRTLLIALLFALPILGNAADDWPASNWIWQLPEGRQSFTGLLTDPQFRIVVRELEKRRGPYGNGILYPSIQLIEPTRNGNGVEAAEILNSLRMDRYRQDCEKLKHGQMHGTPAVYPAQIPWLGSP